MLLCLEDYAKEWDRTQIELDYFSGNIKGQILYEKLGFIKVEKYRKRLFWMMEYDTII